MTKNVQMQLTPGVVHNFPKALIYALSDPCALNMLKVVRFLGKGGSPDNSDLFCTAVD